MRPLAVFDIDGVLADVAHRLHFLERRRPDWFGFFTAAPDDPPLADGVALALEAARECEVVYVTGRPEWCRAETERWLAQHGLPRGRLAMRPDGNRRPARHVKPRLLRDLAGDRVVAVVVDDDHAVCEAYEASGWTVLRATWATGSRTLEHAQEDEGRT